MISKFPSPVETLGSPWKKCGMGFQPVLARAGSRCHTADRAFSTGCWPHWGAPKPPSHPKTRPPDPGNPDRDATLPIHIEAVFAFPEHRGTIPKVARLTGDPDLRATTGTRPAAHSPRRAVGSRHIWATGRHPPDLGL